MNGQGHLRIGFNRRKDDPNLTFRVEESPDLGQWHLLPLPQQLLGSPVDQGDGTEYVEVIGTLPMDGPQAGPKGFMRVAVERVD